MFKISMYLLTSNGNWIHCTAFRPTVSGIPPGIPKKKSRPGLIIGISVSAGVISFVLIFAFLYMKRQQSKRDEEGKKLRPLISDVRIMKCNSSLWIGKP